MSAINPISLVRWDQDPILFNSLLDPQPDLASFSTQTQETLEQLIHKSAVGPESNGGAPMAEERTFKDLIQCPVAKGRNQDEAIYSSTISPMFGTLKAHFVKDQDLHHLEIEEICQFLRETLPTYHEQLVLDQDHPNLDAKELLHVALCEVLAKGLAYRDLNPTTHLVPIPFFTAQGRPCVVHYSVEIIPIEYGTGSVFAYGLVPPPETDLPPILLFRGTTPYPSAETAKDTLITDTCPDGPGFDILFESGGIGTIAEWLLRNTKDGVKKAWITGHSLAGSLTQMVATHLPRFVDKARAFNSPGISEHSFELWNELSNKPDLKVFNHPKDWVSLAGRFFVGDIFVVETDQELRWLIHAHKAHNTLLFLQREWTLFQIDCHDYSLLRPQRGIHSALRKLMDVGHPLLKKWFQSEPGPDAILCTNGNKKTSALP